MTDDEPVLYRVDGALAVVTLNRPEEHNALNVRMIQLLAEMTAAAREDSQVRCVVLTGAGDRAFCSGGDLGELIPRLTAGELEVLVPDPTKRFFSDLYKPVVAAVNGLCIAGGFELMLGTDLRVASDQARFALTETRWGLVPGAGSHVRLPQQIPWALAMQLLLTAEPIDALQAQAGGLVNFVVPAEQVLARAREVAEGIAANAPIAVQTAKEIAVRALGNEARFALETDLNRRVLASTDAVEGPRAFMEKRRPRFEGR